ncbi:MAG: type II toxin-antitoxin system RelB/DinJ family antitoxin [Oxalobacter sp.]|nr:type II toxin-antitoxin system RelB/DinJ family antitoxin [Oxalobacter sp.]
MPRTATRTANVYTRVDPDTKEQAEKILNQLGIPMSHAIVMFLKQVVIQQGIPFEMKLNPTDPVAVGNLTKAQFDAEMQMGMNDMASGRIISADDVESEMKKLYGV